ncbi:YhhN-like protein-domain-containing protein [Triangularia verruculosa]|uniref:YhhN-like protein-domain-containing protein n=1 Tax=Triangularia verruculosa TaxID=2587418 RepID=A0AAN6XDU2_9PEZI|nr:YhhN-like protein-domain-containing protein [Triangularia verruculosa]
MECQKTSQRAQQKANAVALLCQFSSCQAAMSTNAYTTDSAVLAASICSAIVYQAMVRAPPSYPRMVIKTASTALLSAFCYLRDGPTLLVGALALGSTGDAFLAWNDETSFLLGLASFLVAHVLYIVLFFHIGPSAGDIGAKLQLLRNSHDWRLGTAGVLAVLVPVMVVQLMPKVGKDLRAPVAVYSLTIFAMALMALTLESSQVMTGAVMFASSDSILATGRFLVPTASAHQAWMHNAVWFLYYGGQLLIALGVVGVVAV